MSLLSQRQFWKIHPLLPVAIALVFFASAAFAMVPHCACPSDCSLAMCEKAPPEPVAQASGCCSVERQSVAPEAGPAAPASQPEPCECPCMEAPPAVEREAMPDAVSAAGSTELYFPAPVAIEIEWPADAAWASIAVAESPPVAGAASQPLHLVHCIILC